MKKMNLILVTIIYSSIIICSTGCSSSSDKFSKFLSWKSWFASSTEKSLEYGDDLKNAIEGFEKNRKNFAEKVTDAVGYADKKLSKNKPNLPEVAENWETQWNDIQKRYNKLEDDFSTVGNSSISYFNELNRLANEITNSEIKESELRKNIELKSRWTKTYKEAAENIEKIRTVLKDGKDFHSVLVASSIRQKIEQNITELKSISERAKILLQDLENFTIEGRKLVAG